MKLWPIFGICGIFIMLAVLSSFSDAQFASDNRTYYVLLGIMGGLGMGYSLGNLHADKWHRNYPLVTDPKVLEDLIKFKETAELTKTTERLIVTTEALRKLFRL